MLTSTGRCFALAEIEAAFDSVGYGPLWRETLVRATNWYTNNPSLLNEVIDLSSYLHSTHQKDRREKTLDTIFTEVLNYLIVEHSYVVSCIKPFMVEVVSQLTKLDPQKHFSW
ncbi:MAG: hypothetical protein ACRCXC_08335 [Legionella sp.]